MNLYSHATVANQTCKKYFSKKQRGIIILGAMVPDINPFTQPHRSKNLLNKIFNNQKRVKNSDTDMEKLFSLGILLHYLCDYFCYAHRYDLDISHGKSHIIYEKKMHDLLKNGYTERLIKEIEQPNIMSYILEARRYYDQKEGNLERDLRYILTTTEEVAKRLSVCFYKEKKKL